MFQNAQGRSQEKEIKSNLVGFWQRASCSGNEIYVYSTGKWEDTNIRVYVKWASKTLSSPTETAKGPRNSPLPSSEFSQLTTAFQWVPTIYHCFPVSSHLQLRRKSCKYSSKCAAAANLCPEEAKLASETALAQGPDMAVLGLPF